MVVAGDFKNGITFDMDGQVMQVIEFQHVKPGKGAAFVRTKLRNVITGAVVEKTFSPTDKYNDARIERREMQYLYNDGDLYYFMDMESFEQVPIGQDLIGVNLFDGTTTDVMWIGMALSAGAAAASAVWNGILEPLFKKTKPPEATE